MAESPSRRPDAVVLHPQYATAARDVLRRQRITLVQDLEDLLTILKMCGIEGTETAGRLQPIHDQLSAMVLIDDMSLDDLVSSGKYLSELGTQIADVLKD